MMYKTIQSTEQSQAMAIDKKMVFAEIKCNKKNGI